MQSIVGIKENPQSKAECLTNIRKALKQISKFKWDEQDIVEADRETTLEIYKFIKEKFKHSYAMKGIF